MPYMRDETLMRRMKQIVGLEPAPAVSAVKTRHADINIFTVASGLLYEVGWKVSEGCRRFVLTSSVLHRS
jgi:UDP-glucose:glycoprotein glucosyltransferase